MAVPRVSRLSRRSRAGRLARRCRAITTHAAALAVLAAGITASAQTAQAAAGSMPKAPRVASVPVHKVTGKRLALKDETSGNHWKPAASHWPAAGAAAVTIPSAGTSATTKSSIGKSSSVRAGKLPVLVGPGDPAAKAGASGRTKATAVPATGQVKVQLSDRTAAQPAVHPHPRQGDDCRAAVGHR
jgi:hypothetical protein